MPSGATDVVGGFLRRLDEAVGATDPARVCAGVKQVLEGAVRGGRDLLPAPFLRTAPDRYARRLLHRDPAGRYTVVVMVWDRGQGTPVHDHGGMWCVECVYRGQIRVQPFDAVGDPAADVVRFVAARELKADVGEAGALIPPHEHHRIHNDGPEPAVTIHVYGGEMDTARVFLPLPDGSFRREQRTLGYTD